ncbi:MAG: hypothetical protein PHY93_03055 [Bacteriovorax sp.]|nr:hypothetical protein [Bacteriovorax sp.]
MGKTLFWKVALGIMLTGRVYGAANLQVGTLSEDSCWYENKESLRVASFNDKSAYSGNRVQIEAELERLIASADGRPVNDHPKINEMDLSLHCGGYGASLVAKVTTDSNTFCVWAKFDKGNLSLRSVGALGSEGRNPNQLCDGHKWGEFILGANSEDLALELQSPKWSTAIASVILIANKVYKVVLVKDYAFREQEVIDQLQENFSGKNLIRYIEFNDYRHPIGEFVPLR